MGEESDASDKPATVLVNNVPPTATAAELVAFFESEVGPVFACTIDSAHTNWKSRGRGKVQFDSPAYAQKALDLHAQGRLKKFHRCRESEKGPLSVAANHTDIIPRGTGGRRFENVVARLGIMADERKMEVFGEWTGVRVEIVKERGDNALMILLKDGTETYKLSVMFGGVMNSYGCVLGDAGESNAVLLQLRYAPKINKKICGPSLRMKFNSTRYHFCKEDVKFLWVRTTDFSATSIIGRSCYLCLEFANGLSSLRTPKELPFFRELGNVILTQGEVPHSSSNLVPIISCSNGCTVPYEVLFQLNSLVHMQKISSAHVNSDLFKLLRGLSLDTAIEILMKMHKLNSTCYNPIDFIQNHLSGIKKQEGVSSSKKTRQENYMRCRRVLVTPSKVYFLGPELETCNYIVKHYSAYASDFLRVTFVDEDRCKILPEVLSVRTEQDIFAKPYRTSIYNRILSILSDGISVGSKKFEFLAFSASQLRDSSVWMFASNESLTANDIREWMGEFNDIHSISKCAARMGQLFSSATPTFNVPSRDVKLIPDSEVITDGIKYCFSDGIGKISLSFARQVAKQCGLSHIPSAFQIRYGGYKGVIAVDRTSFCKLSLRPSMLKFKSNNTMLNVTKWSVSQPCYLNREIIILLSTLGVNDEVFQSLQYDQMRLLDSMLTDREDALRVLRRMSGFGVKTVEKMLNQYRPDSEPFLLRMLKTYQEYQLSDMRSKCRIFVPKGRVLVGCLDELNTLDYGQVYLRVTMTNEELQNQNQACFENIDQSTGVVVGMVVVTKNPCLHPGDIRVLQAIYDPKLDNTMGLIDCLVFPQKGPRPHPNECSGGDLDGDLFSVYWDGSLVPPKTVPPMDYIDRRPRLMDHKVTIEEVRKFFVDYMINDKLSAIATSHLVLADREPDKALSTKCLELARLHSMAVDYAKSGAPAEMPNVLRPREYPDFMERQDKRTYKSNGVLGKLYRTTISHPESSPSSCAISSGAIPYDGDMEVDGFEAFLDVAQEHYSNYTERLSALMIYYGVEHEDEMLTGYVRNRLVFLNDKRKYEDMKDRMLIAVRSLHKEADGWFRSSCDESEYLRMASAWYHVAYHPKYRGPKAKFLSFPWVMSDVLLSIKASKAGRN